MASRAVAPGRENLSRSRNEVEWIGHLEFALSVSAREVASLIADIGDDRIAHILVLSLDFRPYSALERYDRLLMIVIGAREQFCPALELSSFEIFDGLLPLAVRPASDATDLLEVSKWTHDAALHYALVNLVNLRWLILSVRFWRSA